MGARRHDVTLETLYHYVPESNDPGCSAGFGMGMVMYLGPKLIVEPRAAVLQTCARLPTRFREYTCVHGSGHALMRGYHGQLRDAIKACNELGRAFAPDCAQGAFHDYWISLGGGDGTSTPENADDSPESVCGAYTYIRPCWYRYFWERKADDACLQGPGHARAVRPARGHAARRVHERALAPLSPASAIRGPRPRLHGARRRDTYNCLARRQRAGARREAVRAAPLIRTCGDLPDDDPLGCYSWIGRTLSVVTDGRFGPSGCAAARAEHALVSCGAGGASQAAATDVP